MDGMNQMLSWHAQFRDHLSLVPADACRSISDAELQLVLEHESPLQGSCAGALASDR